MLINTVLLFLQCALPMFIIISLLLLRFKGGTESLCTTKNVLKISSISFILVFVFSQNMEVISQYFDGKGSEVFFSIGFIIIYLCSAQLFVFDNKENCLRYKKYLAITTFISVMLVNGSHFILYLNGYLTQSLQFESLFIGIVLGVGICISFAILFYFLLRYCDTSLYTNTSSYFLLFFAIVQLMQSIVLLQQVDVLPFSYIFWNSTNFIAENTEVGQLLRVLIGYETTPSLIQLVTYLIAFIIPIFVSKSHRIIRSNYGDNS